MVCTGSIKNFKFQHNNEMFVIAIHFALNLLKSFRKEKMFIFPEPKHKLMQTFSQMQKKKHLKFTKRMMIMFNVSFRFQFLLLFLLFNRMEAHTVWICISAINNQTGLYGMHQWTPKERVCNTSAFAAVCNSYKFGVK